jgi:hypothetical protein
MILCDDRADKKENNGQESDGFHGGPPEDYPIGKTFPPVKERHKSFILRKMKERFHQRD